MTTDSTTTGATIITAPAGLPFIDMERTFAAPRALVFRAFTEPDLLIRWLGPHRMTMTIDHYDVRDGGSWRYVHTDPEGNAFGFHGVFHGAPTPDRMVQTFEFEGYPGHVSLDTMRLDEVDGRTVLRGHSVYETVADRDGMVANGMETGMNEGFERLDALLDDLAAAG